MLSGVKLVKVVAEVVCTVMPMGIKLGAAPAVAAGGTKKFGKVLRVKLKSLASIAVTGPVIWLGSSVMLLVVKVVAPLPAQGVELLDPVAVATGPATTTVTS
jgi:hypothetical protein